MEARGYVFDMDGTLAWIPVDWEKARMKLREMTGSSAEFKPVFSELERVFAKRPELKDDVFRALDAFETDALPGARLSQGTPELLEMLAKKAKLALVTLQGRKACSEILRRFDLDRLFLRYFTREDSLDRATQIRMALAAMNVANGDAVFVGDRINDLNASRSVGVRFVMIRSQEDNPGAETIYRNIAEFLAAMK
jgi:phosphoglycolate phosphatase-like HAD superfamily hydrolase